MFEDSVGIENPADDEQKSSQETEQSSWWIGRWSHVIAGLVFCLLYFPFEDRFWSWQLAVTLAYIVFMLCCTCGLAFKDSDDLIGDPQIARYMATLLIRQAFVLSLISLGAYLWLRLSAILPAWAAQRGSRLSLWDICGITLAYLAAIKEASWMAERIKSLRKEAKN